MDAVEKAVFPCIMRIKKGACFSKTSPIVLAVDVVDGIAKVGTPVCIPSRDFICIGRITSVHNHRGYASKGNQFVVVEIVATNTEEQQKMFGTHFNEEDELVSRISRKSIDLLKANHQDDMSIGTWKLLAKLKAIFNIR